LDQFAGEQDRHRSYREKVQRYASEEKQTRDILLYGIWRTGQLKNEKIGRLFGLIHSGVSHAVKSAKLKIANSLKLQGEFDQLNSLFKL
jgi:chromosomal replication initiation ATPase DnaA